MSKFILIVAVSFRFALLPILVDDQKCWALSFSLFALNSLNVSGTCVLSSDTFSVQDHQFFSHKYSKSYLNLVTHCHTRTEHGGKQSMTTHIEIISKTLTYILLMISVLVTHHSSSYWGKCVVSFCYLCSSTMVGVFNFEMCCAVWLLFCIWFWFV